MNSQIIDLYNPYVQLTTTDSKSYSVHRHVLTTHSLLYKDLLENNKKITQASIKCPAPIAEKFICILYGQSVAFSDTDELIAVINCFDDYMVSSYLHTMLTNLLKHYMTQESVYKVYDTLTCDTDKAKCVDIMTEYLSVGGSSLETLIKSIKDITVMHQVVKNLVNFPIAQKVISGTIFNYCDKSNLHTPIIKIIYKWKEMHKKDVTKLVSLLDPKQYDGELLEKLTKKQQ
jgi:hypothetical protein